MVGEGSRNAEYIYEAISMSGIGMVVYQPPLSSAAEAAENPLSTSNSMAWEGVSPSVGPDSEDGVKAVTQGGGVTAQSKSGEGLAKLAQEVNASLSSATSLRFQVDKELEKVVISVVDSNSDETIRQIPNERMLDLSRRMRDLQGLLFDQEA